MCMFDFLFSLENLFEFAFILSFYVLFYCFCLFICDDSKLEQYRIFFFYIRIRSQLHILFQMFRFSVFVGFVVAAWGYS